MHCMLYINGCILCEQVYTLSVLYEVIIITVITEDKRILIDLTSDPPES